MKDDGVGLKVGRIFVEKGYNVFEVGMDIFCLVNYYNGEERIVIIDVILSDKLKFGEVVYFSGEEIFEKLKVEIRSVYFMGVIDGLKFFMVFDERLKRVEIYFIGIVVKEIDLGMELSDEVKVGV